MLFDTACRPDEIAKLKRKDVVNPTYKLLCNRKKSMHNWDEQYFEKVKRILLRKKEITTRYNKNNDEVYLLAEDN